MMFPTSYDEIINRIALIDPQAYAKTRNFKNGAVSYLSPYMPSRLFLFRTLGLSVEV